MAAPRLSAFFLALLALLATPFLLASAPLRAQEIKQTPTKQRDVKAGLLSERVHRDLTRAYDAISAERWQDAIAAVNAVLARGNLNDYERAVAIQLRGHVHAAQGRYGEALKDFEEVIRLNQLPNPQHFQLMYQTAQIYIMQEQYERGLRRLDEWLQYTDTIPVGAFELQAVAYSQLGRYREAIEAIDRAIALSDKPKEQWFQLKVAMHFELKEYAQAARVLELLIERDPTRKNYWVQLASSYLAQEGSEQQKKQNEMRALAVMALAHRMGLLDRESEWIQLYQLYAANEIPYKAAQILEEALSKRIVEPNRKRLEDLANSWAAARELDKALEAYGRAAAYASDGKIDLQRGFILVDLERWAEAEEALAAALRKGGIDRPCNAQLLLGMTQFEQGKMSAAQRSFTEAASDERCRSAASQWLRHLEEVREARAPVAQASGRH